MRRRGLAFATNKRFPQAGAQDRVFTLAAFCLVNVVVSVPCLYGYAGIIFGAPAYHAALPELTKLVLWSSSVHQLVFSLTSSLWYSIGQVQDAGLVYLSSMAQMIAEGTDSQEEAVSTAVVLLGLSTASLGVVVVLCAKLLPVAQWARYIPTPVVAGYLAFIGVFLVLAGLGVACNRQVSTVGDLGAALLGWGGDDEAAGWRQVWLCVPAVLAGVLMHAVSCNKHAPWYALPLVILAAPAGFYWILLSTNKSLDHARRVGWLDTTTTTIDDALNATSPPLLHLVQWDLVKWSLAPQLVPAWLSMCFVVVFASALDITALEDMMMDNDDDDQPSAVEVDVHRELAVVGYGDMASGLLGGGFPGSYVFSLSVLARRTKLKSRWVGVVLAAVELGLVLAPMKSLVAYVPRFLFASVLLFIGLDLLQQGLARRTLTRREYAIVWLTFGSIVALSGDHNNLVLGILLGTLASFTCDYVAHGRFSAANGSETARVVDAGPVVRLKGYLGQPMLTAVFHTLHAVLATNNNGSSRHLFSSGSSGALSPSSSSMLVVSESSSLLPPSPPYPQQRAYGSEAEEKADEDDDDEEVVRRPVSPAAPSSVHQQAPSTVIVDFSNVRGMDTAHAASGLARLKRLAKAAGALLIFSGMSDDVHARLAGTSALRQSQPEDEWFGGEPVGNHLYTEDDETDDDDDDSYNGGGGGNGKGVMVCRDLRSAQLVAKQRLALQAVVFLSRMRLGLRRKQEQQQHRTAAVNAINAKV